MNIHINYQTILEKGKPVFAVVPYREFLRIYPQAKYEQGIPHEVMRQVIKHNQGRIRAWREYLGLTQDEVASRIGITQAALSQMEMPKARLRKKTLEKLAAAMNLRVEQLR